MELTEAWRQVRQAHINGEITDEAFEVLTDVMKEREEIVRFATPQHRTIPVDLPESSVDAYRIGRNGVIDRLRHILKIPYLKEKK